MFSGEVQPVPTPATPNDPFNPDPTIFPPPPPWLFPLTMTLLAIAVMVVLVLLFLWFKSNQAARAERESRGPTQWVDLSKLDKGGRWRDESDQPPVTFGQPDDEEDEPPPERKGR